MAVVPMGVPRAVYSTIEERPQDDVISIHDVEALVKAGDTTGVHQTLVDVEPRALKDFIVENPQVFVKAISSRNVEMGELWSAADVKMEIPVLVRSLKSSILSSTSFQIDKTVWGVVSAAVEQSRRKANMVAQGDGKFGP